MFKDLSEKQREILDYCTQGYNNETIANKMQIEQSTLKVHFQAIYKKLKIDKNSSLNKRVSATILWLEYNQRH